MVATLQFDLDEPYDRMAHLRCVKATDMAIFLSSFYNIRKGLENDLESEETTEGTTYDTPELLDLVFRRLHTEMEEQGINIEELIR